jgi:hypothetical protein
MISFDLTARTRLGAADLEPCFRRDRGEQGIEIRDWERKPAALALALMGWSPERIGQATGLQTPAVIDLLDGRPAVAPAPQPVAPTRTEHRRRARALRFAERITVNGRAFHPRAPHGTPNGYGNYGCRCIPCRAAHSLENTRTQPLEVPA